MGAVERYSVVDRIMRWCGLVVRAVVAGFIVGELVNWVRGGGAP